MRYVIDFLVVFVIVAGTLLVWPEASNSFLAGFAVACVVQLVQQFVRYSRGQS